MSKKKEVDPKTMILDLAKTISYLAELGKTNNQNYVTPEGLALLEGVVIGGNGKVKVIDYDEYLACANELPKLYSEIQRLKSQPKKGLF